jgi:chloramphenicol-sensitive protein RarD
MTVGLGIVVLHEPLRKAQLVALGVGASAVLVLTIGYQQFPYIGLTLATSFSLYSLAKKHVGAGPIEALITETALLFPFALIALILGTASGTFAFRHHDVGLDLRLVGLGVVTAVPLLLFGVATRRVTLVTLGMLQYFTPTGILLLGWLVYDEPMPPARIAGFALIWVALLIMGFDAWRMSDRYAAATSFEA